MRRPIPGQQEGVNRRGREGVGRSGLRRREYISSGILKTRYILDGLSRHPIELQSTSQKSAITQPRLKVLEGLAGFAADYPQPMTSEYLYLL